METKNFYKHLGFNLKTLRKQKGLTQEQFGELFNLTKSAIVNYETGIRKIPIDVLYQIAVFHNVTIDSLISKKPTIADVLKSEVGKMEMSDREEELLVNFIHLFKNMKEGNKCGKSNNQKQK